MKKFKTFNTSDLEMRMDFFPATQLAGDQGVIDGVGPGGLRPTSCCSGDC